MFFKEFLEKNINIVIAWKSVNNTKIVISLKKTTNKSKKFQFHENAKKFNLKKYFNNLTFFSKKKHQFQRAPQVSKNAQQIEIHRNIFKN